MIQTLKREMGLNGRKYVEENFDNKILLKKIIENRIWLTERNKDRKEDYETSIYDSLP